MPSLNFWPRKIASISSDACAETTARLRANENQHQASCRRCVVEPACVGLVILNPPKHANVVCAQVA